MIQLPSSAPYLKVADVAGMLSTSPRQVWRWVYAGELESVRLSERVIRIPREGLERFLVEREKAS